MKVTLYIENRNESRTVEVDDELTIGRTPAARLVLNDEGLSRVNTTVFVEGEEVLAADENSTNGTFVNGEKIVGRPRLLRDGDRLTLGTHTTIRVAIGDGANADVAPQRGLNEPPRSSTPPTAGVASSPPAGRSSKPPYLLLAAAAMTVLILGIGGLALLLIRDDRPPTSGKNGTSRTPPPSTSRIPVRVMDPLGSENEDSLEDLIASWETAEQELDTATVRDVTVMSTDADEAELNVSQSTLAEAKRRLESGPPGAGVRNPGLEVPVELAVGFHNQTRKLAEMNAAGYQQPMDFADLAAKRLSRELIEMPMATNGFFLDVGGSASDEPFTSFEFAAPKNIELPIQPPSPKFNSIKQLADKFGFDLNDPADRREMRRRLLRMFQRGAKPVLEKLASAYNAKFNRPLRVTSLTRSMDYQIGLNRTNANSFKVNGKGSLPPHTSGCAFDLARKHMSVEEQNFLMRMLAEMERNKEVDALIEYGVSACFHIFIYYDGKPPK